MFADHQDSLAGFDVSSVPGRLLAPLLARERAARRWPGTLEDPTGQLLLQRLRGLLRRAQHPDPRPEAPRGGEASAEPEVRLPGQRLLPTGPAAEFADLCCLARTRSLDALVQRFVAEHPRGAVIELKAGLSTALWRVAPQQAHWCAVDRREVIALRQRLLPTHLRVHGVPSAVTDPAWPKEVAETLGLRPGDPVLILAPGAFAGLSREQLRPLMRDLAARFPGVEVLTDAATRRGVRQAGTLLGPADGAPLPAAHLPAEAASWEADARVLDSEPLLREGPLPAGLSGATRARARLLRLTGVVRLVRLRLGDPD
ncbi:MAG: class I SAM-dependent methyltransferase [Actinomycetia bacterium]|nr:class I SAM-dependent methyltransferase [Actinomycetes bacterium]